MDWTWSQKFGFDSNPKFWIGFWIFSNLWVFLCIRLEREKRCLSAAHSRVSLDKIRGLPHMTSTGLWDFLTRSLLFVHKIRKIGWFVYPLPFCVDVIYWIPQGIPLSLNPASAIAASYFPAQWRRLFRSSKPRRIIPSPLSYPHFFLRWHELGSPPPPALPPPLILTKLQPLSASALPSNWGTR